MSRRRYTIRKVDVDRNEKDRISLNKMQAELLPWDDLLPLGSAEWWIAEWHGKPIGFCALSEVGEGTERGSLSRAGVRPGHHGRGLQRRFIKLREREAKKLGMTELTSHTVADNVPSNNNMIACGYRTYMPKAGRGRPETIYWCKPL